MPAGMGDRRLVKVDADEFGVGKGLGHDGRGRAVAAADVGHPGAALQLVDDAVQRRQPLGDEMRLVAGAEEPLDPAEEAVAVIAPAQAAPVLKASVSFGSSANRAVRPEGRRVGKEGVSTCASRGWPYHLKK